MMLQFIHSVLFATDLSKNCLHALEASICLARQHNASIVLLHVTTREVPEFIEQDIRNTIGEEKWKQINQRQEQKARDALIGKMTSGSILEKVRKQYCEDLGLEEANMDLDWREIVVTNYNVDRAILTQAKDNECDLIVLGAGKRLSGGNVVSSTLKGVMEQTKIPVMMVP